MLLKVTLSKRPGSRILRLFSLSDLDKTPTVPQHLYVSESSEIGDNSIDVSVSLDEFMRQWWSAIDIGRKEWKGYGLAKRNHSNKHSVSWKIDRFWSEGHTIAVMYTPVAGSTLVPLTFPGREAEDMTWRIWEKPLIHFYVESGIIMSRHLLLHLVLMIHHLLHGER